MSVLKLAESLELNATDMVRFLASKLYESGRLSLGQVAELTYLPKITFAETLAGYGVPIINFPIQDVINDSSKL